LKLSQNQAELYSVYLSNGQTLKEWFFAEAAEYMRTGRQISMFDRDQSAKASQDANLNLKDKVNGRNP